MRCSVGYRYSSVCCDLLAFILQIGRQKVRLNRSRNSGNLISSLFIVPKYSNFATFSNDALTMCVFISCCIPFTRREHTHIIVVWAFASRPVSLPSTSKASGCAVCTCVHSLYVCRLCVQNLYVYNIVRFRPLNSRYDGGTDRHTVFDVISGFCRGVNELFALLWCYATPFLPVLLDTWRWDQ